MQKNGDQVHGKLVVGDLGAEAGLHSTGPNREKVVDGTMHCCPMRPITPMAIRTLDHLKGTGNKLLGTGKASGKEI